MVEKGQVLWETKSKEGMSSRQSKPILDHLDDVFDELNGLINIPETTCNLGSEE